MTEPAKLCIACASPLGESAGSNGQYLYCTEASCYRWGLLTIVFITGKLIKPRQKPEIKQPKPPIGMTEIEITDSDRDKAKRRKK